MYEYTETVQKFIFLKIFFVHLKDFIYNLIDPLEVAMLNVHGGLED